MNQPEASHARKNLLTGEWVLVSPQRLERPWQGDVDQPEAASLPAHDPDCFLCPGNRRANEVTNPDYVGTFVFDNDFSALTSDSHAQASTSPLLLGRRERGHCKVICYTERHDWRLSIMPLDAVRDAIKTLTREFAALDEREDTAYVQVFENRGRMMGCSNPHPHAQIWATEHLPTEVSKELDEQSKWLDEYGTPLLCDYRAVELDDGSRLVAANDHFVAVVPYWATWPFETLILPTRHFGAPTDMTSDETVAFAGILQTVLPAYDKLFETAAPYTMGFHPRPSDGQPHPEWLFHAHVYPPLLRSSSVRKHMVGFEMLAMAQRDITPESAAKQLRAHC